MTVRFTSIERKPARLKPCVGCVACGGQAGHVMAQAAAHAINPRDPGGPALM